MGPRKKCREAEWDCIVCVDNINLFAAEKVH